MKHLLITAALAFSPAPALLAASATEASDPIALWLEDPTRVFSADEIALEDFKWRARPVVIFADSPFDPAFDTQLNHLTDELEEVTERDIVIITDTDPGTLSDLRRTLRPRGFTLAIIGKDGGVKQRKPFPWTMREIARAIDKMPMRQREIQERRAPRTSGR